MKYQLLKIPMNHYFIKLLIKLKLKKLKIVNQNLI
jgi:hypothetical protein